MRWISGIGLILGGSGRSEEDVAKLQKSGGKIVIPGATRMSDPPLEVPSLSTSPTTSSHDSHELITPASASISTITLDATPVDTRKAVVEEASDVDFNVDALAAGLTATKI